MKFLVIHYKISFLKCYKYKYEPFSIKVIPFTFLAVALAAPANVFSPYWLQNLAYNIVEANIDALSDQIISVKHEDVDVIHAPSAPHVLHGLPLTDHVALHHAPAVVAASLPIRIHYTPLPLIVDKSTHVLKPSLSDPVAHTVVAVKAEDEGKSETEEKSEAEEKFETKEKSETEEKAGTEEKVEKVKPVVAPFPLTYATPWGYTSHHTFAPITLAAPKWEVKKVEATDLEKALPLTYALPHAYPLGAFPFPSYVAVKKVEKAE